MHAEGPGFAVLYRWRLRPGTEEAFVEAWTEVSHDLRRKGSLGSRLHRGPDGIWYSYAQWPSAEARGHAFSLPSGSPAASAAMQDAIAERFPEIVLESVSDLIVPPASAPSPATSDDQAVRATHAAWMAALNAGDADTLVGMTTADVVFLTPGRTPIGRDDFRAGFTAAHEQSRIRCVSELEEVTIAGDVACTLCRDTLSAAPRAGGEGVELAGHRLTIYRRQTDGRWLLARDAHTLTPASS